MSQDDELTLTKRQFQILEGVATRLPLKQIANDLGVSESLVNQTVSALKKRFEVNSLGGLTQVYRARTAFIENECSFPANRFSALPQPTTSRASSGQDIVGAEPDQVALLDASWRAAPPWEGMLEPTPVPGTLDGKNAGLVRAALIGGIALLFFILILVGLGAGQGLTELTVRLPPPRVH